MGTGPPTLFIRMKQELTKELLARLRCKDREVANAAISELLRALDPHLVYLMCETYKPLAEVFSDLHANTQELLFHWTLASPREGLLPEGQSLRYLAMRLLKQAARQLAREQDGDRKTRKDWWAWQLKDGDDPDPTENGPSTLAVAEGWSTTAIDAQRAIEALPEPHKTTLLTEMKRMLSEETRSLAQLLGTTVHGARMRLARAREALLEQMDEKESSDG
jgi:DNA-directed RNA polymerase specialized sigma24 family protein